MMNLMVIPTNFPGSSRINQIFSLLFLTLFEFLFLLFQLKFNNSSYLELI